MLKMESNKEITSVNSFAIGKIVYAKVRGYSAWPAIIEDKQGNKFKVRFFGDNLSWYVIIYFPYSVQFMSIFNSCVWLSFRVGHG